MISSAADEVEFECSEVDDFSSRFLPGDVVCGCGCGRGLSETVALTGSVAGWGEIIFSMEKIWEIFFF